MEMKLSLEKDQSVYKAGI
nr:hypothetical protein [Vibrio coralliilyticus]